MFGGRLASFGEIAVTAGCLCGYPCWITLLLKQFHFLNFFFNSCVEREFNSNILVNKQLTFISGAILYLLGAVAITFIISMEEYPCTFTFDSLNIYINI